MGVIAWSLLGTLLLIAVVLWIISQIWIVVPPLVLAVALIYLLNPVVNRLQARGMARWMGSCISYLALAGVLTLLGFLIIPSIADQARDLADNFPTIYDDLVSDVEDLAGDIGFDGLEIPRYEELRDRIEESGGDFVSDQLGKITDVTRGILEAIFLIVLAPVVAFYLLLDLPTVRARAVALIPERHRPEVTHVANRLSSAIGGFLRGQLVVALIVGVMTAFGFWLIDLPFWLLIGMIAGLLNIIPFIGPWVGGALGVLVALATRDLSTAIWATVVAVVVQQVDNNFVSPTVLRATVRIHPAIIILGLIGGAAIGGFWGVLLAVPLLAVLKIVVGHLWRTRVLGEPWQSVADDLMGTTPYRGALWVPWRRRPPDAESDDSS